MQHIHSHPRNEATGEELRWEEMSGPQRFNHLADVHATQGRQLDKKHSGDIPEYEYDYVLYHDNKRVTGDPSAYIHRVQCDASRRGWECENSSTMMHQAARHTLTDGASIMKALKGSMTTRVQRVMCPVVFSQLPTVSHM